MERGSEYFHKNIDRTEYAHPELKANTPDERNYQVDRWHHNIKRLSQYDPAELEVVIEELHEIPEVEQHAQERVKLENVLTLVDVASDYVASGKEETFIKTSAPLTELAEQLITQVDQYTDTVRRFHSVEIQRHHLDADKYRALMKNVDQSRRISHDALMSHLKIMSRYIHLQIPKHAGADFNAIGWQEYVKKSWFSSDEITDRDAITDWALRSDSARKAAAIEQAILAVLQQKKSGIEG